VALPVREAGICDDGCSGGEGDVLGHGFMPEQITCDRSNLMSILWTIIIGFIVGVIAKFIMPGDKYEPTGFIWTAVLGIVGAFVATYLGEAVGWYKAGESAGFIGGVVGAIIVLFVYGLIAGRSARA
jgi:uncharacterized membrane protein YeaQ/YmgE (transglycosylase-associated protein family)